MSAQLALLSILGTLAIGAISPGPSFVVVVRAAAALSRRDGLASALGMGLGGMVFSGLALGGLQALLMQVDWLYMALKVAGGAYLVYLGIRLWRGARTPLAVAADDGRPATGGWRRSSVRFGAVGRSRGPLVRRARGSRGPSAGPTGEARDLR